MYPEFSQGYLILTEEIELRPFSAGSFRSALMGIRIYKCLCDSSGKQRSIASRAPPLLSGKARLLVYWKFLKSHITLEKNFAPSPHLLPCKCLKPAMCLLNEYWRSRQAYMWSRFLLKMGTMLSKGRAKVTWRHTLRGGRRGSLDASLRWSFQGLLDCYKMALAMFKDHGHLAYSRIPLLTSGKCLNSPGITFCLWLSWCCESPPVLRLRRGEDQLWSPTIQANTLAQLPSGMRLSLLKPPLLQHRHNWCYYLYHRLTLGNELPL